MTTTASIGSSSARRVERTEQQLSRPGRSSPAPGSSSSSRRGRATSARAIRARFRSPCEQSPKRRSAEPAEAEGAEQRVGAVDVQHREPLLEVADRSGRSGPDHLSHGQHRGEAAAVARIDEADALAQARHVGMPHRLAEDLDRAAAREIDGCREGQQRGLAGTVGPEQRPALARLHGPRNVGQECLARAARLVPAPDLDIREPDRGRGLTRRRPSVYTY